MEPNQSNGTAEVSEIMSSGADLTVSKASISEFGERLIDKVRSGEMPLENLVMGLKSLEKVVSYVFDKETMLDDSTTVKEAMLTHLQNTGQGTSGKKILTMGNATFEEMEAGVKYDYSSDPLWNFLNGQLKAREERLKKCRIPDAIRKIEPEMDENGIPLYPPVKTSTTAFKINFK